MKQIFLLAALAAAALDCGAQILINEVMQSNIDCVTDDLNQFPDSWVELYNSGDKPVVLSAYSLGDTDNPADAWPLPAVTVEPYTHAIVYCDKEAQGMHTPFRLESGKNCSLFLFRDGEVADQLPAGMKKQPAPNIAYGRDVDGGEEWGYQLIPSPGAPNTEGICSEKMLLPDPEFSVEGMVVAGADPFFLELYLPEDAPEGTEIHYTLDGCEPTLENLIYEEPIEIASTTVVRAKAFCNGYLSPRSVAQSYIFHGREVTLPVVSILTDPYYLDSDDFGIFSAAVDASGTHNYENDWRRPMNFEIFDGDFSQSCINQLGEARVTGGATRTYPLKSLGIYANKRFGAKRFEHEFFPDQRPGLTDYKSLMLRNGGNDFYWLYMRDAVIQKHMARHVDLDWQAYQPSIVYINGAYKGMLNIRERSNEDNIYTNYGGLEEIDMVENLWELKEGDIQEWYDFQKFYKEPGHTYEEYAQRMDIQEFINVMILNLYYCNLDFPGNNIVHWKPQGEGGLWRIIVKDTDFGLGHYNIPADYQVFKWLYDPAFDPEFNWAVQDEHTVLFRHLMDDPNFRRQFIDCFAVYMGDFMNFDRTWETWGPMVEAIQAENPAHRALNTPWSADYATELQKAKKWLEDRTGCMYAQLGEFYELGVPVHLTVTCSQGSEIEDVTFNGIKLSRNVFHGEFFPGREIALEAGGADRWFVRQYIGDTVAEATHHGESLAYAIPEGADKVEIFALSESSGSEDIFDNAIIGGDTAGPAYNLLGLPVDDSYRGIVIINGKKVIRR